MTTSLSDRNPTLVLRLLTHDRKPDQFQVGLVGNSLAIIIYCRCLVLVTGRVVHVFTYLTRYPLHQPLHLETLHVHENQKNMKQEYYLYCIFILYNDNFMLFSDILKTLNVHLSIILFDKLSTLYGSIIMFLQNNNATLFIFCKYIARGYVYPCVYIQFPCCHMKTNIYIKQVLKWCISLSWHFPHYIFFWPCFDVNNLKIIKIWCTFGF